ncbi:baculoviral IAP repeat-containing protein 7-A [Trichonephila clavipes]|uniref:Baculoviral IAP repeat-containing protein 7-A n=1 Tax=Trichonephila clavipes TaxID=2585209 RepID=A0A8X6S2T2_TRICX|nr:baculoviral IAP repeat-containing protein 7-A [Trichonephila clavipes]
MKDEIDSLETVDKKAIKRPKLNKYVQCPKNSFKNYSVLDVVTFYCCNGSLGNWKTNDDPLTEHEKFFPHCEYVDLIKIGLNNEAECLLKNEVLREACEIFSTLKVQKVAASSNTGQREEVAPSSNTGQREVAASSNTGQREEVAASSNTGQREKFAASNNTGQRENCNTAQRENYNTGAKNTIICKICMNDEMNVVFQPCSHFISCHICATKIFDCPLCRNPVTHKIKVF